eukprot:gene3930-4648_t
MRFRFWSDFVCFLGPYLRVMPAPFAKYMCKDSNFIEPNRSEVEFFKQTWNAIMEKFAAFDGRQHKAADAEFQFTTVSAADRELIVQMTRKYPYLAEPFIALAAILSSTEKFKGHTRSSLAKEGLQRLEEWGMLSVKSGVHGMKEVLHLTKELLLQ